MTNHDLAHIRERVASIDEAWFANMRRATPGHLHELVTDLVEQRKFLLGLVDRTAAEPKAEPSIGPGTLEEIFGAGRSSGGLGDYK